MQDLIIPVRPFHQPDRHGRPAAFRPVRERPQVALRLRQIGAVRVRPERQRQHVLEIRQRRDDETVGKEPRHIRRQLAQFVGRREHRAKGLAVRLHIVGGRGVMRARGQHVAVEVAQHHVGQKAGLGRAGQAVEVRRTGKRGLEGDEFRDMQAAIAQVHGERPNIGQVIVRRAYQQAGGEQDARAPAAINHLANLGHHVVALVHRRKRCRVEAFDTHIQRPAAACGQRVHEFRPAQDVEGDAGAPLDADAPELAAQLFQIRRAAADVVVVEHDEIAHVRRDQVRMLSLRGDDLVGHLTRRTGVKARADRGQRAKIAGEGAAASDLPHERYHRLARRGFEARRADRGGVIGGRDIARLQSARGEVRVDSRYGRFRIAHHDGVEERRAQVWIVGRHHAAEHGCRATPAPIMRDLPRPVEIRMHARQEQEIVVAGPVRILPGVVDHLDVGRWRQQRGDHRADQRLRHAAVVPTLAMMVREYRNDADAQAVAP